MSALKIVITVISFLKMKYRLLISICFITICVDLAAFIRGTSAFTFKARNILPESLFDQRSRQHYLFSKHSSDEVSIKDHLLDTTFEKKGRKGLGSDDFLKEYFQSEIDDVNLSPSMSIIHKSFGKLASGSDIRGKFVNHPERGRMIALARLIGQTSLPALTPFAAHCIGFAFATMIKEYHQLQAEDGDDVIICIGRDPRQHGIILADSFARGAGGVKGVKVFYTGIATTPALFEFCR